MIHWSLAKWRARLHRLLFGFLLGLLHNSVGAISVQHAAAVGGCALAGIVGFRSFGVALRGNAQLQADRLLGRNIGLDSADFTLGSLGADIDPGGPELCRLNGTCGRPDGSCFAAGTPVATATGLRPIESIRPGDWVWAADVTTGEVALKRVVNTFERDAAEIIAVELGGATGSSERLSVTPTHRFWIEGQGWTPAGALHAVNAWTPQGLLPVTALSSAGESARVYNLEVEEFHNYFVGEHGALVHNGDDDDDPDDCPPRSFGDTLLPGPGTRRYPPRDHELCEAFREAVERYCAQTPGRSQNNPEVNELYFEQLSKKDIGANAAPEIPMLATPEGMSTLNQVVQDKIREIDQLRKAGASRAEIQAAENRLRQYRRAQQEVNLARKELEAGRISHGEFRRRANQAQRNNGIGVQGRQIRYPDGRVFDYPLEVKGPDDDWNRRRSPRSGNDQEEDYSHIRQDGAIVEVSCASCGGCSGPDGTGSGCPKGTTRNP
jgi:hypothetical protein